MPFGTGADTMRNLPVTPFTPDPARFDQLTAKNHTVPVSFTAPGSGKYHVTDLPKSGILVWLTLSFNGTLVYADGTGSITTAWNWPYGLVRQVDFAANLQNGLISASGIDLHVHRFLTNPSYVESTDTFPGTVGGGDSLTDSAGAFINLTWQIPVVMDRTTLIGAIYAQSNQNALTLRVSQEDLDAIVVRTGNATASLTGTFKVAVTSYEIPQDEHGIITPDLSRLHGMNAFETAISNTGDTAVPLIQENGQLARLLIQVRNSATAVLDPKPSASAGWSRLRLMYGANQNPLDFDLSQLVARNNEQYGGRLPYGYVALDFVRENAVRDGVIMPSLTDLRALVTVDSGVSLSSAKVRIVQETLFS
jgi:hypothetical protein